MNIMKKSLSVAVILLFIGVAIAQSINVSVVKASFDNDLVEVTSEACGMKGFGNQTVKLTKQQYQNLEQYLVEFRARLNQTSTREEAVPIFKEAVVELNKYGLLPKGMNIKQAQKLVVGGYQNQKFIKTFEKLCVNNQKSLNYNALCLVAGQSDKTFVVNRLANQIYHTGLSIYLISADIGIFLYENNPSLLPLLVLLFFFWYGIVFMTEILDEWIIHTMRDRLSAFS